MHRPREVTPTRIFVVNKRHTVPRHHTKPAVKDGGLELSALYFFTDGCGDI